MGDDGKPKIEVTDIEFVPFFNQEQYRELLDNLEKTESEFITIDGTTSNDYVPIIDDVNDDADDADDDHTEDGLFGGK